ncbi:hypothetical protein B0T14DRAFT_437583 [Immersiella caudata]|uniref:SET domain-containing protein n=1 Tax=Immersiella caudata TaxID=314043 RepID=A0AA39WDJ2_9PEZI|nr:hypothetical protein B0T14DRAFT_437583 [Immersiella caudata]
MPPPELLIADLPIWARLNDIRFGDFEVKNSAGKGHGVVCRKALTTIEQPLDESSALTVPHGLVLNVRAVEEYAKEDRNFKQLLDAVGHRSPRADILLFLLVQTALASRTGHYSAGLSNPWMEYIQFLPRSVSVPSMWTEDERLLLRGTSLETAVNAKMLALVREFDHVQSSSEDIPCWYELLWQAGAVSLRDWIRLDGLHRSRCLELPKSGESMVPCIDMVNHAQNPTAYYDENSKNEVTLLLRPGITVSEGQEVTISYGKAKSAAEMLFSYGFIDKDSTAETLVLPLEPLEDDPLGRAKLVAFGEAPKLHVGRVGGSVVWQSPFVHLMCINEEDGLDFRVLQDTQGVRQLRVFWQDGDVTDRTTEFESLVQNHALGAVFRLRAVTVVQERLQSQLELARSYESEKDLGDVRPECLEAARTLHQIEAGILEGGIETLEKEGLMQKTLLLSDENVVAYLGSMETAESDLVGEEASSEVDDFS